MWQLNSGGHFVVAPHRNIKNPAPLKVVCKTPVIGRFKLSTNALFAPSVITHSKEWPGSDFKEENSPHELV